MNYYLLCSLCLKSPMCAFRSLGKKKEMLVKYGK